MISPITTAAKTVTAAVLVLLVSAAPVWGTVALNAAGLGTPVEALTVGARALGSMGIGLGGPLDHADRSWWGWPALGISTGVMAASPSWVDYSASGDRSGSFQGNRIPLVGIGYPFFGGMASVQFGSFLDQSYEVTDVSDVGPRRRTSPDLRRIQPGRFDIECESGVRAGDKWTLCCWLDGLGGTRAAWTARSFGRTAMKTTRGT